MILQLLISTLRLFSKPKVSLRMHFLSFSFGGHPNKLSTFVFFSFLLNRHFRLLNLNTWLNLKKELPSSARRCRLLFDFIIFTSHRLTGQFIIMIWFLSSYSSDLETEKVTLKKKKRKNGKSKITVIQLGTNWPFKIGILNSFLGSCLWSV